MVTAPNDRIGGHVEAAAAVAVVLLAGLLTGDWAGVVTLSPSPLVLAVLWAAFRRGLGATLSSIVLAGMLYALAVLVEGHNDPSVLTHTTVGWPVFLLATVGYVAAQARDLLRARIDRLEARRTQLQDDAAARAEEFDALERMNGDLQRRVFDRTFDLEGLVASAVATDDAPMAVLDQAAEMLVEHCGAEKASVLLVTADGTLDLAAHRGWPRDEVVPRLATCNQSARVLTAIADGTPALTFADIDGAAFEPVLVAPVPDASGAIHAVLCLDQLPPARYGAETVRTFRGIAAWLLALLERHSLRDPVGSGRAQLQVALERTKRIGSKSELAERVRLEDARQQRYGVPSALVSIRLLDLRVMLAGEATGLETRLLHVLTTTCRRTDDVFRFGFAGCYALVVTGTRGSSVADIVTRLRDRFAAFEGKDFGPVDVQLVEATPESPTVRAQLELAAERFRESSPMPLAPGCPVKTTRLPPVGDAAALGWRLRLEAALAERLESELYLIDFRREGPGLGVGPMIARHLALGFGARLRQTDGIFVLNAGRCVVVLPHTGCLDAAIVWSRLDEALRSTLPAEQYAGVQCDFLAVDPTAIGTTLDHLAGQGKVAVSGDAPPTGLLTDSELQQLALEFGGGGGEGDGDLEREIEIAATSGADVVLPSATEMEERWDEVFADNGAPAAPENAPEGAPAPRRIVRDDVAPPRLPDGEALCQRWDELFHEVDEAAPAPVEPGAGPAAGPIAEHTEQESQLEDEVRDDDPITTGKNEPGAADPVPVAGREPMTWRAAFDALVAEFAASGERFTSSDLRTAAAARGIGEPPQASDWATAINAARRAGLIRRAGRRVPSTTAGRHGAKVAQWIGCEPVAAAATEQAPELSTAPQQPVLSEALCAVESVLSDELPAALDDTVQQLRADLDALRAEVGQREAQRVPAREPVEGGRELQEVQRQLQELRDLIRGSGNVPAAAPGRSSAPSDPGTDPTTLGLLERQIEGLFALCRRAADSTAND